MKKKIAIFISGRGSNMEAIINNAKDGILRHCCDVVLVFSNKKEAKGLNIAEKLGIETLCIESKGKSRVEFDREVLVSLEPFSIDYIILAGFMRILSPLFIKVYKNKIINIHPADTRLYQGENGYKWAFENKLEFTKITIHLVDEGIDTGKIIAQQEVSLIGMSTLEEIEQKGLLAEHKFYSEVLERIFTGKIDLNNI